MRQGRGKVPDGLRLDRDDKLGKKGLEPSREETSRKLGRVGLEVEGGAGEMLGEGA